MNLPIIDEIFKAYDVRGIYPSQINEEVFLNLGKALANKITDSGNDSVVVCMDGRLSSSLLKKSLVDGLTSMGLDVIDIGLLPTPFLYFSLYEKNIPNGIMITGSHNPKEHNGIKIVLNWQTLFGEHILELKDIIKNKKFKNNKNTHGKIRKDSSILKKYIDKINKNVNIDKKIKVIIDCANGATGVAAKKVFESFGMKPIILNENVDGNFPNHPPNPSDENNLLELKENIIKTGADIGIAYDGDGDRVVVIRKDGSVLWPDELLMLFSKNILKDKPKSKIIFDVKCSKNLEKIIYKNNGIPIVSRTGHSFIKKKMEDEKAILGGEMSGHIFFADKWDGYDDGIYSSLRLLEIISSSEKNYKILFDIPTSYTTPEINIPFNNNKHFTFMKLFVKLAKFKGAEIIDIDGLKIIYPDSWGLIRCSNTTSNLVLRFEGDNMDSLKNIQSIIKNAMLEIDNTLQLPF